MSPSPVSSWSFLRWAAPCVAASLLVVGQASAQAPTPAATPSPWSVHAALDAPEALKVSGSVRTRFEAIEGQVRPGFEPDSDLFNVRSILFAEYDFGAVRVGGEFYDSRAYGGNTRTPVSTNEVNSAELVQAYVAVDLVDPFGPGTRSTVQAGRFLLNLGSRRLVAADDYRNTTNGYTGLRADAAFRSGVKATLIYTYPQIRLPDDLSSVLDNRTGEDRAGADAVLWGGVVSKSGAVAGAMIEASYFRFDEKDAPGRPTRDRALDTVSLRLIRDPKPGALDYEVELIGQSGSVRAGLGAADPTLDVSAGFIHADLGYVFQRPGSPRLSVEFDYASGDGTDADFTRFDTLFGMRRADLAPSGLYNAIGRTNILTPGLRIEATLHPRLDVFLAARGLWLASDTDAFSTTGVRDATGRSGDFAGRQLEGRARWWLIPNALRFETSAVWLDKAGFLQSAPNAPRTGDSRYVSLNLTAMF